MYDAPALAGSAADADAYFQNMLRDQKNKDYLDKIYYEMANFELKRSRIDPAIDYLNQSIQYNTKNNMVIVQTIGMNLF